MKNKHKSHLLWLAVFAWLATLLFLSFQTGEETAETSGRLAAMVFRMLSALKIETSYAAIHEMMRTAAHIVVFLIFGGLLEAAVNETKKAASRKKGISAKVPKAEAGIWKARGLLTVMFVCASIAVLSEVLKIYIPGRHLDWLEAGLNVIGAWLGCGGMYAVERLSEKRKRG